MIVYMKNDSAEILFLVAQDFLKLSHNEQLKIGIKLKLFDTNAAFWAPKTVEETVFRLCYKNNLIPVLVKEMYQILYGK